jgi:hypothetical protein
VNPAGMDFREAMVEQAEPGARAALVADLLQLEPTGSTVTEATQAMAATAAQVLTERRESLE